jgi:type I site-specific restriction endonuclease
MEFVFGRDGYFCTPLAIGCWSRKVILFPYDQAADMPNQVLAHQIWMDLERGYRLLGETCLLVTGSTSYEEREQVKQRINSGSCKAIAGSRGIFSEGISVDSLSCVILAIPIANEANLEQIIGRIMRIYPNKPKPLVLDLNFAGWADKKQNDLRLGFYMKQGWDMEVV